MDNHWPLGSALLHCDLDNVALFLSDIAQFLIGLLNPFCHRDGGAQFLSWLLEWIIIGP